MADVPRKLNLRGLTIPLGNPLYSDVVVLRTVAEGDNRRVGRDGQGPKPKLQRALIDSFT
jgi:hypothetical protein